MITMRVEFNKHIINNVIKINFVQYFSDRWSSVRSAQNIYIYLYVYICVINYINKYIFYLLAPITSAPNIFMVLCVDAKPCRESNRLVYIYIYESSQQ